MLVDLLHVIEDVVSQLSAVVVWHMPPLPHIQLSCVHQPDLSKLILIEIDLHFQEVVSMAMLKIKAHNMAHFETVNLRLFFLELIVVVAKLAIVKAYSAIK